MVVTGEDSIRHAAQVMRDRDVGLVPVVDDRAHMHLRGVITDRDIAIRCAAEHHGGESGDVAGCVDRAKVTVDGGWVTLEGEVEWKYQRKEEKIVARLTGVRGVTNFIQIKPHLLPAGIEQMVHNAFRRHAEFDADEVFVEPSGCKGTLRGRVRSWPEYEDAEWAVWSAPGVGGAETAWSNRLSR